MRCAFIVQDVGNYHNARYRALASLGVNFTVLAVHNEAGFAEFMSYEGGGYPIRKLFDSRGAYIRARKERRVWPTVHATLSKLDPNVVIVAGWSTPESFAAIAWARKNCRRLVMMSASQASDASRSILRESIKRRIVGLSDAGLVGGPAHRDYAVALGMPSNSVYMGYDAVDNAHFSAGARAARSDEAATRLRIGMPKRYLLASARFIAKKNLPRLISAYAGAIEGRPDAPDLVILGDGPERAAVERAIVKARIVTRVHLVGFRSYQDLPALYGLSQGFVHVSTSEQWGLVINEAAASGVPVVASSACGATGSLVANGETGFVVEADSEASICEGVRQLIDIDPDRWSAMGQASERKVADWGPNRFADSLISACRAAETRPARGLTLWDRILLGFLSRTGVRSNVN